MSKNSFSAKQLKAIELIALGEKTSKDIALELKCNPNTISVWKKKTDFMEAVVSRSRQLLKHSLPKVYKELSKHSKGGSHKHIKIFLDHIEHLDKARSEETTITFTWKKPND